MKRTQLLGNRHFLILLPAIFLAAVVTTALADKKDDRDQARDRDKGKAPLVIEAPAKDILTVGRREFKVLADAGAQRTVHASERRKNPRQPEGDPIFDSLSAVPHVTGPIAQNAISYMFSTMKHAKVPFDVADYGYVEEEFFLSATANVYDNATGELAVVIEDVPYLNRILVRRPARPKDSSGVVLVDILNASNGYDVEDHWRRMWEHAIAEGHTYLGITSKPINVDALKNFDELDVPFITVTSEGDFSLLVLRSWPAERTCRPIAGTIRCRALPTPTCSRR